MQISKSSQGTELLCPACGGQYLHHGAVDVFERHEDAEHGRHTHVPSGTDRSVIVTPRLDGNPSCRRDGIRIEFRCEMCSGRFSLCIAQHKGVTYLHWERSLERKPWAKRQAGYDREWQPFERTP